MKSFLHLIAADMLAHFSNDMRDVTVVFPGKRAGMFLNRKLAQQSEKPVWAPHYCMMSDLFQSLTHIRIADPLECICQLYGVMKEVLGEDYTETLDDFWSWGEVLMADFNDIDMHMANAQAIFTNIADQERLKNLDYLDDHQRETLKRFFGRFSLDSSTRLQEKFLQTWSHMYEIYTKLHERLFAEGKLWEGALYRHVCEQMQCDENLVRKLLDGKRAIVFAGFNVLNDVEHSMMSLIQREGKARFYWDYDIYYCDPKSNHEAGYFMKQNLRDFPCAITETELFDNFRHLEDVTFISCTTDNAAARYTSTWGGDAIVLCNEALMLPVLHSLPDSTKEVNVTMGFPVSDTPVYSIVMALLKLQIEGYDTRQGRFRYPIVQAIRRQPLFHLINEDDCFVYHGDNTTHLLDYLLRLLRQIALHYAQIEEPNIFEQLYGETLFRTDRMLCLLRSLIENEDRPLDILPATLRRLLRQMMMSTKIPFHSEPDRGLQLMGMLETRQLDFEHLLLLSVEEGNLPRNSYANSLIPESLRDAFGLTTQRHRIAVYAYYFYRLAQRCKHLTCVYNERCAEGVQHEMSRFLRQMLAETDIPIRTLWLRSEPEAKTSPTLEIKKTKEVMDFLLRRYDQNMPDGEHIMLSPSAINTYISCPMQFYLDKVLRIRQEDNPEEGLANNTIGTIFHDSAELFYDWLQKEFGTDTITADMLCKKIEQDFVVRDVIKRQLQLILHVAFDVSWFNPFDGYDRMPELLRRLPKAKKIAATNEYRGTVLIAHGVLERYLLELIRYDASHAPFRIIGSEVERHLEIEIPSPSGSEENIKIKVGGRVDRIDEMGGRRRIVDYKTGTFKPEESVTMKKVMSSYESIAGYYRQLFIYSLAEAQKKETTMPIQPILFYPSQAADRKYEPSLNIAKKDIDDFATQHGEEFREGLQSIIADIFDPEKPFICNGNENSCKYCKLSMICGKKNY